jgi:hypothetical protein
MPSTVVILGTGGTIAGTAANPADNVGYTAAQRSVGDLVAAVPSLGQAPIQLEQIAQLDSKDMDHATWQRLAQRVEHHLARPEVCGVVITHGTDTMEETAWFLQRVLAPGKPVVLTGAMRPSTALQADGPQNLLDACVVAREAGACGVVVVFGGQVHSAHDVRKVHTYRIDAFSSGDGGPIARVEEGRLRRHRLWPVGSPFGVARLAFEPSSWPRVGRDRHRPRRQRRRRGGCPGSLGRARHRRGDAGQWQPAPGDGAGAAPRGGGRHTRVALHALRWRGTGGHPGRDAAGRADAVAVAGAHRPDAELAGRAGAHLGDERRGITTAPRRTDTRTHHQ